MKKQQILANNFVIINGVVIADEDALSYDLIHQ